MYSDPTHPLSKITSAIKILEVSKAELLARSDELVGYENEYVSILDGLIGMMKSAEHAHWFKTGGGKSWDTRDGWKLDALRIAETLVKD